MTRVRTLATGRVVGGVPFTRGPLAYLLKNRMYLGEINHGSNSYPGEHPAIVNRDIFASVQARLASQTAASGYRRSPSEALLTGKLFDHLGRPMTPSHAVKGGVRYRYYISRRSAGVTGVDAAPIVRVPASDVEDAVLASLSDTLDTRGNCEASCATSRAPSAGNPIDDRSPSVRTLIERINIRPGKTEIELSDFVADKIGTKMILVPWSKRPTRVQRDLISPLNRQHEDPRAMSSDTRTRLLSAIAAARRWMGDLADGRVENIDALAAREGRSARSVTMLVSLAFLASDLVKAIVDGRMSRGIGLAQLVNLPIEWRRQVQVLRISA